MANIDTVTPGRGGPVEVAGRQRWLVMGLLCVGQLMIILDSTVVNVALPIIQVQLHFSQASLAWVLNGYLLTFGGLLLLAGRLGDLLGRSRIFLWGLSAFVVSSALCGLAPTAGILVAARLVQGSSAAMTAAMVLGIITPMFPSPRDRTLALSVFAFVAIGGVSLGLVLGGLITEALNWHWIFFINVPFGTAVLIAAWPRLPDLPGIGIKEGADLLGALLVTGAPMFAVYGLINAGAGSWGDPLTIGPLVGGVVAAVLFVVVESKVSTPLIPLRVFRHRNLTSAAVVRSLFPMGAFSINFLGALYLEHVLGYSPLRTGMAFLPSSVMTGLLSVTIVPWLVRRFSMKSLIVSGLVLLITGMLLLSRIGVHSSYLTGIFPAMALTGVAFGLIFMPSVAIAMNDVGPDEAGIASALTNVAVQIGGSLGLALLATVSTSRTHGLLARHDTVKVALTGGYKLGILAGSGFATASLVAALVLIRSAPPASHAAESHAAESHAAGTHAGPTAAGVGLEAAAQASDLVLE